MTIVNIGNNTGNSGGMVDARVDSYLGSYSNGSHSRGYAGWIDAREMRELQRFDLSSIPAGSVCDAALLYLYDTDSALRTADETITLYEIAAANGTWIEGTAIDERQLGSPSWIFLSYSDTAWAGSDGLRTAGTDYVETALGSLKFTDGVSGYRPITLNAAGRAVIERWFGTTGGNGWILVGPLSAPGGSVTTEWHSRQGTDGNRPYLRITYGGRPRPGQLLNAAAVHRASRW